MTNNIIWEEQPIIKWGVIKMILGSLPFLIIIPLLFLSMAPIELFIAIVFINGIVVLPSIYFTYDFFIIKSKYKYQLGNDFLMVKAGNKLTTKYFKLEEIEDFELRRNKIVIHLKESIWNPYLSYMYWKTKTIKMGPFINADGIYIALNQHLLDYKNNNGLKYT